MEEQKESITYAFQGIVRSNVYGAFRVLAATLGIPMVKRILRIVPGIDQAVLPSPQQDKIYVELVPATLGIFDPNWHIRENVVESFKQLNLQVRAIHAPYVDDGATFQSGRKSWMDNVLDLTVGSSATLFCLYSHIQLYEMLSYKEQEKVLIVHPLPSSPNKSEEEIITAIKYAVKKTLPLLHDQNVRLVIENMPWLRKRHQRYTRFLGDALFYDRLMNEIDDPYFGVIFDWGHANTYARFMYDNGISHPEFEFTPESLQHFEYQNYFINRLKDHIYYAHLHFNEAHDLTEQPPFYHSNFDVHHDLTFLNESEYEDYRKNVLALHHLPHLVGMTVESVPSLFNRRKRIQRYKDSIEILNSMIK